MTIMLPSKVCNTCGESKPLTEFYKMSTTMDGHSNKCRDCDNSRIRTKTVRRIVRNRARHRAMKDLAKSHPQEFRVLYEQRLTEAFEEADRIKATEAAQETYDANEVPRLKKGPPREDEEPEDRVDTEWCQDCATYHQRGHVPCKERLRDGRVIDLTVLEEFNAGIARARRGSR